MSFWRGFVNLIDTRSECTPEPLPPGCGRRCARMHAFALFTHGEPIELQPDACVSHSLCVRSCWRQLSAKRCGKEAIRVGHKEILI